MTATTTPPSIREDVTTGLRWGAFNQVVQQVTRFVVQLVLTRLLAPEAFGLLTLAFVVINFGAMLTGLGFTQALIQRRDLTRDLVDAVFVGSALLGIALAFAVFAGAAPLAGLLGDPEVAPVLRACSLVFLFQGVEGAPNGMLRRDLRFRPFVLSSTIAAVVAGVVAVSMAVGGAGVWALVAFALVEAVVATILAWGFAIRAGVWRPRLTWDLRPLRSVLGYSGAVTSNRLLFYGSRNVDNLIVGRVLGATALGFYGLAYRVMLFPIQRITDVVSSVALPAFAHLQEDAPRLHDAYLRAVRSLAAVIAPITLGVALVAHHLVPVVFGPQWEPAVVPLRILALSGPALAIVRLNGNLWEAIDRAGVSLAVSALVLGLMIPAFIIGVGHGVAGVAVAYTATAYLGVPVAIHLVDRTVGIGPLRQLANLTTVGASLVAMVAATVASLRMVPDTVGHLGHLVVGVIAGAGGYLLVLTATDRELVRETLLALRPRGRR